MQTANVKYQNLQSILSAHHRICVAYSGGVDSTFLLYAAIQAIGAQNVIAVMANGRFMMEQERRFAIDTAHGMGITPIIIEAEEFEVAEFCENHSERCYFCKKNIFTKIIAKAAEMGYTYIIDGSNADDAADYRPGRKALSELGITGPLEGSGLTKAEIRKLSHDANLPTANYPSRACLASRVPYGVAITPQTLDKIAAAEGFLMDLGFMEVRARYHGSICIIEVPISDFEHIILLRSQITERFKQIGFAYITLDLQGIRTGSMNETL